MKLKKYLLDIIKVELHIHIEGTLEPEMVFEKALKNNIKLPYKTIEDLKSAYTFTNLGDFLKLYYENIKVLKNERDFYDLTWAYLNKAHKNNIHHVEMFFDPQPHLKNNINFNDIVLGINKALLAAKQQWNLTSKLIMCFLKDEPVSSALKILDLAKPQIENKIIEGIGLDSSESEGWVKNFLPVFTKARSLGLFTVCHAGEESNDVNVNDVIDILKPQRIDHGLQAINDIKILKRLKQENIHLTLCPLSNKALKVYSDLSKYPIETFLNYNISFGINSDDPAYFGGYINENFIVINNFFNLTKEQWKKIIINTVNATFLTQPEKEKLIEKIIKQ